jgi:hypothetical protein
MVLGRMGRDALKSSPSRIEGSTIVIAGVLLVDIFLSFLSFFTLPLCTLAIKNLSISQTIQILNE